MHAAVRTNVPHGCVEMILHRVVRAARQRLGYATPSGPQDRVLPNHQRFFKGFPTAALAVDGAHMVKPPLPALLAVAPREMACDEGPCVRE